MVRPKKHLGQHFLTDHSIAARIAEALPAEEGATVMEIGPGKGILTAPLLNREFHLIPVEVDSESVEYLIRKWPEIKEVLVYGDFLKLDISSIVPGSFHLIGNFPYHISNPIFFKVLEYRQNIPSVVCMVQKEVAVRICSPPGSRKYGILSVLLQAFYSTEYLFTVKPGSFFPPPKVTSGVMRLRRNRTIHLGCDEKLFFRVVKTVFNQRRKIIRNSIKSILLNLEGDSMLLRKRPEQLAVSDFVELTRWVESRLKQPEP